MPAATLEALAREIDACRRCPRLVAWRESVAADPPRRYQGERYWARPLPGFGDPRRAAWSWSGSRRPRTAATAPAGSSPATAPATGCSPRCTGPASRTSRTPSARTTGCACAAPTSRRSSAAPRRRTGPTTDRARHLPALPRARAARCCAEARVLVALGSFAWDGALLRAARQRRPGPAPEAALRPRRGGRGRPLHAARLLPPEPAEHVHRASSPSTMIDAVLPGARSRLADGVPAG